MTPPVVRILMQSVQDVPGSDDWLSSQERAVQSGLRFPKRRVEWRLGRWTAKRAVARALGRSDEVAHTLAAIQVVAATDGAPEVSVDGAPAGLAVSISHRDGRAVCAVGPAAARLGCDLELVEPRSRGFLTDYLTPEEVADVERMPTSRLALATTLVWSAKESALKALRSGLRADTRSVVVDTLGACGSMADRDSTPADWQRLRVRHDAAGEAFAGWWRARDGFVLTVLADVAFDPPPVLGQDSFDKPGTVKPGDRRSPRHLGPLRRPAQQ